jgi:hypothetical protein
MLFYIYIHCHFVILRLRCLLLYFLHQTFPLSWSAPLTCNVCDADRVKLGQSILRGQFSVLGLSVWRLYSIGWEYSWWVAMNWVRWSREGVPAALLLEQLARCNAVCYNTGGTWNLHLNSPKVTQTRQQLVCKAKRTKETKNSVT